MRTPVPMEPATALGHLAVSIEAFEAVIAAGDLDAPVAACPGWQVRQLAHHLGRVHRWAVAALTGGGRPPEQLEPRAAPEDREALGQWYADAAGALAAVLGRTEPSAECWGFGPRPHTAAFWFRRQLQETSMHAWDAVAAVAPAPGTGRPAPRTAPPAPDDAPGWFGTLGTVLTPAVALDGIDEVRTVFFPRQVRLGRMPPLAASLALEPEGDPYRWVLAGTGAGPDGELDAPAQATVRGPTDALLLLLWHRIGLGDPRLTLDGDAGAAGAVLAAPLTP